MSNKSKPFKERLEITFGESDKDLWEWLNLQNERRATFVKKVLRNTMDGSVIDQSKIQKMIKEEVEKLITKTLNSEIKKTNDIENQSHQNTKPKIDLPFKAKKF
jgi:hypothetical protein